MGFNLIDPGVADILDLASASLRTLRELDLLGSLVGEVPIRAFNALTHLEICVTVGTQLRGLELVFHHAVCLESLVLAGAIDFNVYAILQAGSSALPRLVSFHLSSLVIGGGTGVEYMAISDFIRERFSLQRLSLHLSSPWSEVRTILPILRDLPALRTLGLCTGFHLPNDAILELASYLPLTIHLLHLDIDWNDRIMDVRTLAPLVNVQLLFLLRSILNASFFTIQLEVLASMPSLWFLKLDGIHEHFPLPPEDLARDLKHLEIFGWSERFWDVFRVESEMTLTPWPFLKARFRMKEDLGGDDGDWLLKYS